MQPHGTFDSALDTRSKALYLLVNCEAAKCWVPEVREYVYDLWRNCQISTVWTQSHGAFGSALDTRSEAFCLSVNCEVAKFRVPEVRKSVDDLWRETQNITAGRAGPG